MLSTSGAQHGPICPRTMSGTISLNRYWIDIASWCYLCFVILLFLLSKLLYLLFAWKNPKIYLRHKGIIWMEIEKDDLSFLLNFIELPLKECIIVVFLASLRPDVVLCLFKELLPCFEILTLQES